MALPLQPDLRPNPPWLRRLAIVLLLMAAVLGLGVMAPSRARPPELVLSGPGHELEYTRRVVDLIDGAKERVWVLMYVMHVDGQGPEALVHALAAAAARGVHVQVCLDQAKARDGQPPDTKHVAAAEWLAGHGIHVVLDEIDRTTHAKTVLADERWLAIGSHNWTNSAQTVNRETSLVIESPELAKQLVGECFAKLPGWDMKY